MTKDSFLTRQELALGAEFIDRGYVIRPAHDRDLLKRIRFRVAELAAHHLGLGVPEDPGDFLNRIGDLVDVAGLNAMRLAVIEGINAEPWFRSAYFSLARPVLEAIVGNELVMQRRINLSVQLPGDDSSLLPVHADVWSGDSPFEVVQWLPLVDCYDTKAMYLLPPTATEELHREFGDGWKSSEELFARIEPKVEWIGIKYGEVMVFNQTLPHGNRVNQTPETRWSMNCRFKSVFSPYGDKKLGEFFEPVTLRAATRIGMSYQFPGSDSNG